MMRRLALFDLDHTLLPIDSDHEWIEFLIHKGCVSDPKALREAADEMFRRYKAGVLKVEDSIAVMLSVLKDHRLARLAEFHEQYMAEVIRPKITQPALDLVNRHLELGDLCCLVSATNTFVISPIARAFGFQHIIGTDPEIINGRYTGKAVGTPSYREGKIVRVHEWLASMNKKIEDFEESWFYSDSINDIFLLEQVTYPVCTNPDDQLRKVAQERHWHILDLFEKE
ncbi:HAD family hydrolase [Basilea psittacipulmonis]|uniref:Phosphoserine phosphatase n=1 Tax=Basilea psittacipulmonis DSM 24701 TaxID=1072685 RepID=A0A077DHG9_9BURK|nr:HAD family hydrolase [Basilea psittacipulmonis]AIL32997.1 hypothetical protein IX83_06435 [Basilea psittacipulmonis DSM 24701]